MKHWYAWFVKIPGALKAEITVAASLRESRCSEDSTQTTFFCSPHSLPNTRPRNGAPEAGRPLGDALQRPQDAHLSDLCSGFRKEKKDGCILRTWEGYMLLFLSQLLFSINSALPANKSLPKIHTRNRTWSLWQLLLTCKIHRCHNP